MMNSSEKDNPKTVIRRIQYRDLEAIASLVEEVGTEKIPGIEKQLEKLTQWYAIFQFLQLFPNPFEHYCTVYVAEELQKLKGLIQVSPFNSSRSTWRVEWVLTSSQFSEPELATPTLGIGSQLLRHCFETIWEARTWILEVNINDKKNLALYRQNGFQPLAQLTSWSLSPFVLEKIAQHEPDLPNLLPVSNADANLIYQLDTVSMPPLLRQVFDRHIQDFKTSFLGGIFKKIKNWMNHTEVASGYVFEPQRKAAIGYFKIEIAKNGDRPHVAELTVHPAYTWLYPQLLAKMAQIVQGFPSQSLELVSADYQPEREEYLEKLGANAIENSLLMSRSVWHKLRESKPLEGLQLSEILQGLKPARTPIPSRMSWLNQISSLNQNTTDSNSSASVGTEENCSQEPPENTANM